MSLRFRGLRPLRIALSAVFGSVTAFGGAVAASANGMTTIPASASGAPIPIYVATPEKPGRYPAVLFLHGCEGFSGLDAVAADRLTPFGFVGAAIDAIGPDVAGGDCRNPRGAEIEASDARAALAWLAKQPYVDPTRLALVGFSMGGIAVLNVIDPPTGTPNVPSGLRAAVAFYPDCDGRGPNLAVPLAIFDGGADTITPAPPCATLVAAAKAAGKTAEITTYPGATHAFNVPGPDRTFFGQTLRFDQNATDDSARRTFEFLNRYLTP